MKRWLAWLLLALPLLSVAQDKYPSRPITLVAPFPPGGSVELTGRPLAASLEKAFKQPVVFTNRVGAAGAVGTAHVASSEPDGYRLLINISAILVVPEADKLFDRKPAYTMDQLIPVARINADPNVLLVRTEAPWKSVQELIADAKKKPGQLSYSSSGVYGSTHVPAEMFTQAAGIQMRHVPFTGGGPATNALAGGHVDIHIQNVPGSMSYIHSGKLRPLAVTSAKRSSVLPDVPTMKEVGIDMDYGVWHGIFVAAKTPPEILKVIRDAARTAIADPDFVAAMQKISSQVAYMDQPEFEKFVAAESRAMAALVKRIGRIEEKK
jgi:tripartite-type tricarboxylate transporter receptor subunit TctC